jgi:hypothetical protein
MGLGQVNQCFIYEPEIFMKLRSTFLPKIVASYITVD